MFYHLWRLRFVRTPSGLESPAGPTLSHATTEIGTYPGRTSYAKGASCVTPRESVRAGEIVVKTARMSVQPRPQKVLQAMSVLEDDE